MAPPAQVNIEAARYKAQFALAKGEFKAAASLSKADADHLWACIDRSCVDPTDDNIQASVDLLELHVAKEPAKTSKALGNVFWNASMVWEDLESQNYASVANNTTASMQPLETKLLGTIKLMHDLFSRIKFKQENWSHAHIVMEGFYPTVRPLLEKTIDLCEMKGSTLPLEELDKMIPLWKEHQFFDSDKLQSLRKESASKKAATASTADGEGTSPAAPEGSKEAVAKKAGGSTATQAVGTSTENQQETAKYWIPSSVVDPKEPDIPGDYLPASTLFRELCHNGSSQQPIDERRIAPPPPRPARPASKKVSDAVDRITNFAKLLKVTEENKEKAERGGKDGEEAAEAPLPMPAGIGFSDEFIKACQDGTIRSLRDHRN